ncbi:MAG: hypothetical protein NW208_07675 [Bryobacter sp.]|nr:hypothetical protein [Bryobacter sp.]
MAGSLWAGQKFSDFQTPLPLGKEQTLVIGIAGGWESWNTEHNLTRRLTLRLRDKHLPGVHVETVENHRLGLARQLIEKAFAGAERPRLVVFGHSLGGLATVRLARWCEKRGIPVAFTLQIDSVGWGDTKIPANVEAAANLYQESSLFLRGESKIRAADPQKTNILGNYAYRYSFTHMVPAVGAPWYFSLLQHPHIKMEYDPEVWLAAEQLLTAQILKPSPVSNSLAGTSQCPPGQ